MPGDKDPATRTLAFPPCLDDLGRSQTHAVALVQDSLALKAHQEASESVRPLRCVRSRSEPAPSQPDSAPPSLRSAGRPNGNPLQDVVGEASGLPGLAASFTDDSRVRPGMHRLPGSQVDRDLTQRLAVARRSWHRDVDHFRADPCHLTFGSTEERLEIVHERRIANPYSHRRRASYGGYRHEVLVSAIPNEVTGMKTGRVWTPQSPRPVSHRPST
jgi:hypothetical protein